MHAGKSDVVRAKENDWERWVVGGEPVPRERIGVLDLAKASGAL